MSYDYIKRAYTFCPEIGKQVRHTVTGKVGVIRPEDRSQGHYVQVRFADRNFSLPCHPMELEYLEPRE